MQASKPGVKSKQDIWDLRWQDTTLSATTILFQKQRQKVGAKAEILSLINLRHCPRMGKNMTVGDGKSYRCMLGKCTHRTLLISPTEDFCTVKNMKHT